MVCYKIRACLHGGGGPQVSEVTRLGGVTRPSIKSLIWSPHQTDVNVIKLKRESIKTGGLPHLPGVGTQFQCMADLFIMHNSVNIKGENANKA